jgi:hypothetical protein
MAINATSAKKAFDAFRNNKKKNDPHKRLKNEQLQKLLDGFTDKYPALKDAINSGKALELMNKDSQIANMVIDYFTQKAIPILCIHDSFIIQHDKQDELGRVLGMASVQVAGKEIKQDSKANTRTIRVDVYGNVSGFETKKPASITIPDKVKTTGQYQTRKSKFDNWLMNRTDP